MCGIVDGQIFPGICLKKVLLRMMGGYAANRGPDASGYWFCRKAGWDIAG
jgi:asparagine synthetase B (glutamine-hydrolysing)